MSLLTSYMGLSLINPIVASSSPLTGTLDGIRQLEDAGAAAIVLPSLFQEEIEAEDLLHERLTGAHDNSWPEASTNFPMLPEIAKGPHRYLDLVRRASEMTKIPIIASLNGVTNAGWVDYARSIEQAGAKALELNIFMIPTDFCIDGISIEQRYLEIVRAVRDAVSIPLAVKLSPYFSSIGNLALQMESAGADAFVLFNRFYQPDLDIVSLKVVTDLALSGPSEIRLPLLWIAVLSGRLKASLAAASGVTTSAEVIKYVLAGADVVMTTSALLRDGPCHIGCLIDGLERWLEEREFASITVARGIMSRRRLHEPAAFERANYLKILHGYAQ